MLNRHLFREEALARQAQPEPIDYPMRVTAPHEWLFLALLGVGMLVVAGWGVFGSVERTLAEEGVLVQPGDRFTVMSTVRGSVSRTLVGDGDAVQAGQPLALLDLPDLALRVRVARARVEILERQAAESSESSAGLDRHAMEAAQAELVELQALHTAGATITSPWPGRLSAYPLAIGQAVEPGTAVAEVRAGDEDVPDALAVVDSTRAASLEAGMAARVTISMHGAPAPEATIAARVVSVSPQPARPPPWQVRFGLDAGPSAGRSLIRLALDTDRLDVPDGTPCRVVIVIERRSPMGLLLSTGAG